MENLLIEIMSNALGTTPRRDSAPIREDYSSGKITSLPMLEYLLIFEPGPRRLVAYAQSKPDENGKVTDYVYQMEEGWPDDEEERNKIIKRRHLDCFVQ